MQQANHCFHEHLTPVDWFFQFYIITLLAFYIFATLIHFLSHPFSFVCIVTIAQSPTAVSLPCYFRLYNHFNSAHLFVALVKIELYTKPCGFRICSSHPKLCIGAILTQVFTVEQSLHTAKIFF